MTKKQKAVAKDLLENPGKAVSRAMLDAGYSPSHARNPQDLTESKGWQQLMQEFIPDETLARVHQEGLEAMRPLGAKILVAKDGTVISADEQGVIEVPDHAVRHKYLETAYKLKGKLGSETLAAEMKDGNKTVRIVVTRGENK